MKTENLFLSADGGIRLGDFGFARFLEDQSLVSTRCGSDGYSAPELARDDGQAVNPKLTDVWSIGVILFTILTKSIPFDKPDMVQMNKTKCVVIRFPRKMIITGRLRDLIGQFLTFEPTKRIKLTELENHPWLLTGRSQSIPTEQHGTNEERSPSIA